MVDEDTIPVAFIGITETWWRCHTKEAQVQIPGYNLARCDRQGRIGGGCGLYVHESLTISDQMESSDRNCNLTAVYVGNRHTVAAVVYRAGTDVEGFQKLMDRLQGFIDYHSQETTVPDIWLIGDLDFNLPLLKWDGGAPEDLDHPMYNVFRGFMETNLLSQMVSCPTRGNNVLDLILTNRPDYVSTISAEDLGISDHKLVSCTLSFNCTECSIPDNREKKDFAGLNFMKADWETMNQMLSEVDWESLEELCHATDRSGGAFVELLRLTVLQVATMCVEPKQTGRKWRDKKLRHLRSRRRKLNRRMNEATGPQKDIFEAKVAEITALIKDHVKEKQQVREEQVAAAVKSNPKFFFSHAKSLSKVKSSVAPLARKDGTLTADSSEKAELLQAQYVQVFSLPSAVDPEVSVRNIKDHDMEIADIEFSQADIEHALEELRPNSAAPPGDIPACVLKNCRSSLSYPIWILWQESYYESSIPPALKEQFICPVFKKGDRSLPENYRPVALTSHLSKTFERVVRDRLTEFLEKWELHCNTQHGFRKGRSTMTHLLAHVDRVLKNLADGNEVDVLYLDFQKAFDRVDTRVLLRKLQKYGVRGRLLEWIREFLTNRRQAVLVDGEQSCWEWVISSVIQGSVLGPILFIFYVLDLKDSLGSSDSLSFADDTKLIQIIRSLLDQMELQKDLGNVSEWAKNNNMLLHEKKFQLMNYSLSQSRLLRELPFAPETLCYVTSGGTVVEPEPHIKDLGVWLSADGTWTYHIGDIVRRASIMSGWIFSAFKCRSREVLLTLYKALVRPLLEYCCLVWSPTKVSEIKAVENVQRAFTRKIYGMRELDYWEWLKSLKLMSLQRRRQRYELIHVWKIYNKLVPNCVGMEFHTGRLGIQAKTQKYPYWADSKRANQLYNSFSFRAPQLWNKLPREVTLSQSLSAFKANLGNFMEGFQDRPPSRGYPSVPNDFSESARV